MYNEIINIIENNKNNSNFIHEFNKIKNYIYEIDEEISQKENNDIIEQNINTYIINKNLSDKEKKELKKYKFIKNKLETDKKIIRDCIFDIYAFDLFYKDNHIVTIYFKMIGTTNDWRSEFYCVDIKTEKKYCRINDLLNKNIIKLKYLKCNDFKNIIYGLCEKECLINDLLDKEN